MYWYFQSPLIVNLLHRIEDKFYGLLFDITTGVNAFILHLLLVKMIKSALNPELRVFMPLRLYLLCYQMSVAQDSTLAMCQKSALIKNIIFYLRSH